MTFLALYLYLYDQETDSYQEAGSVDAWDWETFAEEYPHDRDQQRHRGPITSTGIGGGVGSNRPVDESAYPELAGRLPWEGPRAGHSLFPDGREYPGLLTAG